MNQRSSSYYPPRAGWNRRLNSMGFALRRRFHLENLNLPKLAIEMTWRRILLCLFVPGFSFLDAGWKWLARIIGAGWLAAACVFFLWLGYAAATVAFGLMMSFHVSSILHFLNRASPESSVWKRLMLSLAVLFAVSTLVYRAGLHWLQKNVCMPLHVGGKVYVVNRISPLDTLHRGDWIAFHSERVSGQAVYIQEGYVLNRILGCPGDEIEFTPSEFRVNGIAQPRLPFMPANERLTVAEETWLVWPSLETKTIFNVTQDAMSRAVLRMATVKRDQIIGTPFHHWFWRDQTL